MAQSNFNLQEEYSGQAAAEQAYTEAAAAEEPKEAQMVNIPVSSDQLTQMKAMINEERFDEIGRIVASLIS